MKKDIGISVLLVRKIKALLKGFDSTGAEKDLRTNTSGIIQTQPVGTDGTADKVLKTTTDGTLQVQFINPLYLIASTSGDKCFRGTASFEVGETSKVITFPSAFSVAPQVFGFPQENVNTWASGITTTQFTLNRSSDAIASNVFWFAIGG